MNEKERQKLVERRKREQKEKEITNSIAKHLKLKDRENDIKAISEKNDNRYVEAILLFFGTLIPLYVFIFFPFWTINFLYGNDLSQVGIHLDVFMPYLHASILLGSIIGIYRRESLLDTFLNQFTT